MNSPVIRPDLVGLDVDYGSTTTDVITRLAGLVHAAGRATSVEGLAEPALAREAKSATGVPGRVAIPHCRSAAVSEPTLAFARLSRPVDFSGPDGDAELVFLIAAPEGGGKEHLKILSKLARALVKSDFVAQLKAASSEEEIVERVLAVINQPKKSAASQGTDSASASSTQASSAPTPTASDPTPTASDPASVSAGTAPGNAPASAANAPGNAPAFAGTAPTVTPVSAATPAPTAGVTVTRIVAITACPTGIAHTYMAADSLTQTAAVRDDVELVVETQGSSQTEPVAQEIIDRADAVIFATDIGVRDRERFAGKPVIESGVKRAINEPAKMIDEAITASTSPSAVRVAAAARSSQPTSDKPSDLGWAKRIQQAVMTGVSYMVPFVAAGGLLLALGFLLGGYDMANAWQTLSSKYSLGNLPGNSIDVDGVTMTFERSGLALYLGAVLFAIGQHAMQFVVAALSGYIAFALAGRPGIAPGFATGAVAVTLGAGFLGGLITGLLAGLVAMWIGSWKTPRWLASLMPVVIIPLLTTLTVGLLMYLVLGAPVRGVMTGLQTWLSSLSGSSAVLLGIILGLMMCFDLGGPVNKAAYLFATAGLSTGDDASMMIMATVMAAGMVPPIALSLATFVSKSLFTPAEQENGKSAWLLGLSFVSEGAIPFAAADPLRVIPSMMLGGAVTGALTMALNVMSRAPHGGVFVAFAITPVWAYFFAIAVGVLVSAAAVILLKKFWPSGNVQAAAHA